MNSWTGPRRFCTFQLSELLFGIDVLHVSEVLTCQRLTPVPMAGVCVLGLMNLRGEIVAVTSLRAVMGFEEVEKDSSRDIVVRTAVGLTAFRVDEVVEVLDVENDLAEPVPECLPAKIRELIPRVHRLEGRILHEIDVHQVRVMIGAAAHRDASCQVQ